MAAEPESVATVTPLSDTGGGEGPTEGAPKEPVSDAPKEIKSTPTPEPAEEPEEKTPITEFKRPDWLDKADDEEAAPVAAKPAVAPAPPAPPAAAQAPTAQAVQNDLTMTRYYIQQFEANPPQWNAELALSDGAKYQHWFTNEWAKYNRNLTRAALLEQRIEFEQRFEQVSKRGPDRLTLEPIVRQVDTNSETWLREASQDAAYSDPKVRGPYEEYVRALRRDARKELQRGVRDGADTLADANMRKAALLYYKLQAGYPEGKVPESVATPATIPEAPRGTSARSGLPKMDAEEKEAYDFAKSQGLGAKYLAGLEADRKWNER